MERLTPFELRTLRECAGELPASPWGAAVAEALASLRGRGLVDLGRPTEAGRQYLERMTQASTLAAELDRLGVVLPLAPDPHEPGVVRDAEGRDVITVDVNSERPDEQVDQIAQWIVLAVNTCGGFRAEAGDG